MGQGSISASTKLSLGLSALLHGCFFLLLFFTNSYQYLGQEIKDVLLKKQGKQNTSFTDDQHSAVASSVVGH